MSERSFDTLHLLDQAAYLIAEMPAAECLPNKSATERRSPPH
jgi:hypothetical protein